MVVAAFRTQLTVKIAEKDVNRTTEILRALPEQEVKKKQDAIAKVRTKDTISLPYPICLLLFGVVSLSRIATVFGWATLRFGRR
jgi:hypothetical protein